MTAHTKLNHGANLFFDLETRFQGELASVTFPTHEEGGSSGAFVCPISVVEGTNIWLGLGVTVGNLTVHVGPEGDMYSVGHDGDRITLEEESTKVVSSLIRSVVNLHNA